MEWDAMDEYVADLLAEAAENKDTHLDLSGLDLTVVPTGLTHLVTLTHLSLRGNQLKELPAEIGNLINLQQLSVADNFLASLPEQLGELTQLQSLNLKNNQLTELPLSLLEFPQLDRLQLHGNELGIPADLVAKYDRPQEILNYYREHCVIIPPPPPRPLSERVAEAFNEDALENLIDDLCVPPEEVETENHNEKAAVLIKYHETHGLEEELLTLLQVLRPTLF